MKNLTLDQIKQLEHDNNVYIDIASMQYNMDSRDVLYGWAAIPMAWIDNIKNKPLDISN